MSDAAYRFNSADQDIRLDADKITTEAGEVHRLRVANEASALAYRFDEISATLAYLGHAQIATATSAASWRIQKFVFGNGTGDVTVTWADGNADFDNVWDDRAALSYS
ncbi:MAG: hypothetical protein E4H01_12370 [Lysobacterales bacterium]|nr:MAG: hypothetical protein E4H01_12370 [Xanthomonadales bacterium]